jgi:hypothetical protein
MVKMTTLLSVKTPPRPAKRTQEFKAVAKIESDPFIDVNDDELIEDEISLDDHTPFDLVKKINGFDLLVDHSLLEEVHSRPTVPMMERLTTGALACLLEFDV